MRDRKVSQIACSSARGADDSCKTAQNNLGLALAAQNKLDLAEQAYSRAIEMEAPDGKESEQPYQLGAY